MDSDFELTIICNLYIASVPKVGIYTVCESVFFCAGVGDNDEVANLAKLLLGRWAEIIAKVFSMVVLLGANVVYWVLMSNFLYNSVIFFYGTFNIY